MTSKLLATVLGLFSMSVMAQDFAEGQIWQYKTRPEETDSRLYIVKVDSWPNGEKIFHIYVDKLKIKNPMLAGGIQTELPHAPVSEKTLKLSVTRFQKKTTELPNITEGYDIWKEEYDKGGAGVFTISVSEIITLIEGVVSSHERPRS